MADRGLPPWETLDEGFKAMIGGRFVVGDADQVGEHIQHLLSLGLDGMTFNMPADGHDPDAVTQAGEIVTKALT